MFNMARYCSVCNVAVKDDDEALECDVRMSRLVPSVLPVG